MRALPAAALVALLVVPRSVAAADESPPVPQDAARQEQLYRDLYDWNRRTLVEAYEKVGKKDPSWDKLARQALEAAARHDSRAVEPSVSAEEVEVPAGRAVKAGCDDPLILYTAALASPVVTDASREDYRKRAAAAGAAMEKSEYPPYRRAQALYRAGSASMWTPNPTEADRAEANRLFDAALVCLTRTANVEGPDAAPGDLRYARIMELLDGFRLVSKDAQAAFDRVDAVLAGEPALKVLRLQVKGGFLIQYAWEARGSGVAPTVTQEGWKKFEERLVEAHKTLTEAWSLEPKPKGARTPISMLTAVKGLGLSRDHVEAWFKLAMQADPNSAEACELKMDYLDPKWHGTPQDLMAFGRACRATRNWRAKITLVGVEPYMRLSFQLPPQEQHKFLSSQEVWDDVRSAYEEYLEYYPADHATRSFYAVYCYFCGRYAESDEQFKALGPKLQSTNYFPDAQVEQIRKLVDNLSRSRPTAGRP